MSNLHYWDYKYLCELEQRNRMKQETTSYWTTNTTYGDDIEVIYHIKK
jgi:hypothetical protein